MATNTEKPKGPHKLRNFLLEAGTLVGAIMIGLVLGFGVYGNIIVISGSMEPTIKIEDRFIIDHRPILSNKWRRGDVVIFDTPQAWEGEEGDTLVKRVVGLPNESIELRAGKVLVNGTMLDEPFVHSEPLRESGGPYNLGVGEYFVLGDNRGNSADSSEYGPLQNKYIRARVALRIWPFTKFGRLPNPYQGFTP